jgi:hypothetical protein
MLLYIYIYRERERDKNAYVRNKYQFLIWEQCFSNKINVIYFIIMIKVNIFNDVYNFMLFKILKNVLLLILYISLDASTSNFKFSFKIDRILSHLDLAYIII